MKSARNFVLVLVTAPNLKAARVLAKEVLSSKLAACVNLLPGLESHYWWQGKLEKSSEVLLLIKTTRRDLAALEKRILQKHPYDTPEIIALPIDAGNERYLGWWRDSVKRAMS